jgi:DNA polymerase sigma
MLMDFFELYGINFNYVTTGISLEGDGGYFQKANHVLYDEVRMDKFKNILRDGCCFGGAQQAPSRFN